MKGLENPSYLYTLIAFNVLALFFSLAAVKWPRLARFLFFLLFSWACWLNWTTSQTKPNDYLQYAQFNFINWYTDFILGWFSKHIQLVVGIIAISQGLIAMSMFLKGCIYKIGCIGGIIFFLAITPLGVGSGFPCPAIFAIALGILYKKGNNYLLKMFPKHQ